MAAQKLHVFFCQMTLDQSVIEAHNHTNMVEEEFPIFFIGNLLQNTDEKLENVAIQRFESPLVFSSKNLKSQSDDLDVEFVHVLDRIFSS